MILDMNTNVLGVNPLDSPIWQMSTPPVSTNQRQGVGGPVEEIIIIKGNAGGASAQVTGGLQTQ
jgi:hypothetical protein